MQQPAVAVIGGGVTGLVAARHLALSGCKVSLFEASGRIGGQVRTADVLGHAVDVGAESLHLGGPTVALLEELGLSDQLITANSSFVWIWDGHRRRRLPAGVGPTGPTRLWPVARSGVLSPLGMARAALEPLIPSSTDWNDNGGDVAVGRFIAGRFGRQVTDRLVDPVLGSLHAGDVGRLSLRAATPMLAAKAVRSRSLLLGSSSGPRPAPPSFVSFADGLGTMIEAILVDVDVSLVMNTAVQFIVNDDGGFRLEDTVGELGTFDGVVVALPAAPAARVLRSLDTEAANGLESLRTASVATVALSYRRSDADTCDALRATGVLTPSHGGTLLKAATFLGTKWAQLHDDDHYLVRLSAGRVGESRLAELDDHELVAQLTREFERVTALHASPELSAVYRWPNALPQLEVGHLGRMNTIRSALGDHGAIRLAGAACDGLGISSCIGSGRRSAKELCEQLAITTEAPT